MKKFILLIILCILATGLYAQNKPAYDKALADSLGADEYGMKMYVLVILKTGPNQFIAKERSDSLFRGHLENINRLVAAKKLIVAGPLGKNDKNYRGIFILSATMDEVNALLQTDPVIREKLIEAEVYPWYGSAALGEYLKYHDKIEKTRH
jgi:uncharacterized protein YciI